MKNLTIIQRRVIVIAAIITVLIGIIIAASIANRPTETLPTEVTSLPIPSEDGTKKPGVYGVDGFSTTSLSKVQITQLDLELNEFLNSNVGSSISYITIDKNSIALTYNQSNGENEVRFSIVDNSGVSYRVLGRYINVGDIYTAIFTDAGAPLYQQQYDIDTD